MRKLTISLLTLALITISSLPIMALDLTPFDQHGGEDFFTIKDDAGEIISKIGSLVSVGDYLITEDDSGYRISAVDKFEAKAKYEGKVDLLQPGWVMVKEDRETTAAVESVPAATSDKKVGLYFTHSEESYVPNSGTHQEKKGDIYEVGQTLAESLRKNGVEPIVSEAIHSPRDANSYNRSRSTAVKLLKDRPGILVDVHRDGIPDPDYYNKTVSGQQIAQIRVVVGKQNANRSVNFDFAKAIKAKANELYPGLVKEIFWARGNYNQDLAPRAILLEFGTHTNTLERADKAAEMMGKVLATMVGAAAPQQQGQGTERQQENRPTGRPAGFNQAAQPGDQTGGWGSALWVLGIAVVGFIAYALLNSKGAGGIKYMLSKFRSKEMAGFLGQSPEEMKKKEIKIPPDEENKEE